MSFAWVYFYTTALDGKKLKWRLGRMTYRSMMMRASYLLDRLAQSETLAPDDALVMARSLAHFALSSESICARPAGKRMQDWRRQGMLKNNN